MCRLSCAAYGAFIAGEASGYSREAMIIGGTIGALLKPLFVHLFTAGVASFIRPTYDEERNLDMWTTTVIPAAAGLLIFTGVACLVTMIYRIKHLAGC
jgi:hypothetical protein